jgi:hypothetical protein
MAEYYRQLFFRETAKMRIDYSRMYDGLLSFKPGDNHNLPGFSF